MGFERTHCGRRILVSMIIAMAFSIPLLYSSRAQAERPDSIKRTPAMVQQILAPSVIQRGQSDSDRAQSRFGEGFADESDREVPKGPDPLYHRSDPKVRH